MYKSLQHFIDILEKNSELVRVKTFVNPELEITEIIDRLSKQPDGGKAVLFENNGTKFPVLINALGSIKRICLALGVEKLDDIGVEIETLMKKLTSPKAGWLDKLKLLPQLKQLSSMMPKVLNGRGKCQEVIINNPDLNMLPVLKCWQYDGGKFITFPIVHTKDPLTGIRNIGMYRLQIFDKDLTGMHWHRHKTGARHYAEYKKLNQRMPIAVALGGDPVYTYCATAPLPDHFDEYMFAGFLRKQKVNLVKCLTQDIEVPEDADIIIEGYVDPAEEMIWEGPFGDHTGFYSLPDWYPKFHVTCITHRKDAVYPATIVGIPPMEDAYIAKATERIFVAPIKLTMLPEMVDMEIPNAGVAHNLTIVKINKTYPGQALKVMNALWGAGQMMFNKVMIVVDDDVDIHNYPNLINAIFKNFVPQTDIHFSSGPLDVLDHASDKMAYGGKMGIDATRKLPEEKTVFSSNKIFDLNELNKIIAFEFHEILNANFSLLLTEIPVAIFAVNKSFEDNLEILSDRFIQHKAFDRIKICLFVDYFVDVQDLETIIWLVLNNIDPKRDCKIYNSQSKMQFAIIDGRRKTRKNIDFPRQWPNIIVSDDSTINKIDHIWHQLTIGPFIESPSRKYKKYVISDGAEIHAD